MAETLIDQALKSTSPARLRACADLDDKERIRRECSDAADCIEELQERAETAERHLVKAQKEARAFYALSEERMGIIEATRSQLATTLISTAERLPEIGVQVICTGFCYSLTTKEKTDQRWWAVAHRDDINRWIPERHGATDGIDQLYQPTHWAPLPNLRALPDKEGL